MYSKPKNQSGSGDSQVPRTTLHVDWALITIAGNLTRYLITRQVVEKMEGVLSRWYPIRTWYAEDPLRFLPDFFRIRLRHAWDARSLFFNPPADVVVIHAFETYSQYVYWTFLLGRSKQVIIAYPDGAIGGVSPAVRQRTDRFILWSEYQKRISVQRYPNIPPEKWMVLHPGIDLARWPQRLYKAPSDRFKLLFVGGHFARKGGDTLIEAFETLLGDTCELHVVTQSGWLERERREHIERLPHAHLYLDLKPGTPELQRLFATCDAFVLPTNSDSIPWVCIEALATGIPVIVCPEQAIPEMIIDGVTGLHIPPRNPEAIAEAVAKLRSSETLRRQLIERGRQHAEARFDAKVNTEILLDTLRELVAERQGIRR